MVLKRHTSLKPWRPQAGKIGLGSETRGADRQACSALGCGPLSGSECAPRASTLIQLVPGYLESAKDGLVVFGTRGEAARFRCFREAWAHMGREGVPVELQKGATLVIEYQRPAAASDGEKR